MKVTSSDSLTAQQLQQLIEVNLPHTPGSRATVDVEEVEQSDSDSDSETPEIPEGKCTLENI